MSKSKADKKSKIFSFGNEKRKLNSSQKLFIGSTLIVISFVLLISFTSYFFSGNSDQSTLIQFTNKDINPENWMSKVGAFLADLFLHKGFGISSYIICFLTFISGLFVLMDSNKAKLIKHWFWGILIMVWISLLFGLINLETGKFSGIVGFESNLFLKSYIGNIGTSFLLLLSAIFYLTFRLKVGVDSFKNWFTFKSKKQEESFITNLDDIESQEPVDIIENNTDKPILETNNNDQKELVLDKNLKDENNKKSLKDDEITIEIKETFQEESETDNLSKKLVKDFGLFDPKLELASFKFPNLDILKKYDSEGITINKEELEENKTKIVNTLNNYKIGIESIKATIGPTVTLYEIVPEAGVRISKIKNLEDDIALSLSALGIRIIAPIPGKGTIGIEVPNKNSTIVSMHSVISSQKFQQSEMILPIALGKTISNETLVVDLAKMPHLLMAGATGQGKSVGLNAVLTSLLYKKHPAEVKFVLVDPKKVELTLFNKIERHYLAKLPDSEEAIITDNTKVINTLNSLCIEMDNRYDLLKNAQCRNIVEYNKKFKSRKLNPNDGHQFLPYIVLVVDEFADLIMTAGKEVETPIARIAQLARAIGIHLIIATQRPSVNVITGVIKANFPARIAFRVTSKIDSRTILDSSGADQLIGRGDMLYTQGNELIRVQCAFVDTPEVEKLTDFIGSQKAYASAHVLPEYIGDESGTSLDIDISDRDKLFREAAEVIVIAQQGSASLLQRKLKLGYNRAGRLIDQLEAAGIVGPFEGSKARQVIITDLSALDRHLENEKNI
ncbi:MAG: DNA translocase FtsK 4TM domain-containing protein [Flavobacteriaceae bacterium]|nr:DNA translocase FtsK 4TM domain-containing protein [Flavobacteriaceae bacterium]